MHQGSEKKYSKEDFDFGEQIGAGSFSQVFVTTLKKTGKKYATKVIQKQLIVKKNLVKTVKTEKEVLGVMHHPNIISLLCTYQDEENLYFALEYAPGGELFSYISKYGPFTLQASQFYAAEILNGLQYMHSLGIIHRDMKPENVILSKDLHSKITDFGTAKVLAKRKRTVTRIVKEKVKKKIRKTIKVKREGSFNSELSNASPTPKSEIQDLLNSTDSMEIREVNEEGSEDDSDSKPETETASGDSNSLNGSINGRLPPSVADVISAEDSKTVNQRSQSFGEPNTSKNNEGISGTSASRYHQKRRTVSEILPQTLAVSAKSNDELDEFDEVEVEEEVETEEEKEVQEEVDEVIDDDDETNPQQSSEDGNADVSFSPSKGKHRQTFCGTAEYVSPEILVGIKPTRSSDLWALGCIVFQMLTGYHPFKAPSEYLLFQKILKRELVFPPGFPLAAKDFVDKLLQLNPKERLGYKNCEEIKSHPFFAGVDFARLHNQTPPPIGPIKTVNNENSNSNSTAENGTSNSNGEANEKASSEENGDNQTNPDGSANAELTNEADATIAKQFLLKNEKIVYFAHVIKRRNLSSKKRLLIMTDKPRLFYVDPQKSVMKGMIPFSQNLKIITKSVKDFIIKTPKRNYVMEDISGDAYKWVKHIDALKKKFFNVKPGQ